MADRMEGTALLSPVGGEYQVEYLHCLCVRENGDRRPWRIALPVRPRGTPVNPRRTTWEYAITGDTIEVSPSVKIGGMDGHPEQFHNEGIWRVKFERFTPSPEIIWFDGVGDHGQRARFTELNPGDFSV
jgi:hypothetical protein